MEQLVAFVEAYQNLGWLLVLVVVLWLRWRKIWIDGPTYKACEDRLVACEEKLDGYRATLEEQARSSARQTETMADLYLSDRRRD